MRSPKEQALGQPPLARISQAPGLRPDGTLESRRAMLVRHRRSNLARGAWHSHSSKLKLVESPSIRTEESLRFADRAQACLPDAVRVLILLRVPR